MTALTTLGLALAIAGLYVVTTYLMKAFTDVPMWVFAPVLAGVLIVAIVLEIHILKNSRMGSVFVLILSLEVVMTMVCACWLLGERYSLREMAGLAIIVAGIAVVWWPQAPARSAARDESPNRATSFRPDIPADVKMPRLARLTVRET